MRIDIDAAVLSDLDLLSCEAYAPVHQFMGARDYERVLEEMRLNDGQVWPLPIVLPVQRPIKPGETVDLVYNGPVVARMVVSECYTRNLAREARRVYGTEDTTHPGVRRLVGQGEWLLAGEPELTYTVAFMTPHESRLRFAGKGWKRIAGFQTRNPIHRAHEYLLRCALEMADGLFIHPLVGETRPDDLSAEVRWRCYKETLTHFPAERVILAAFPAYMRYAGPREALFHALVRRNYGCTHFIVGRDAAGVGDYYGPYDAQKVINEFDPRELGIEPLCFKEAFYCKLCGMATVKTCPHGLSYRVQLSGTQLRAKLAVGEEIPEELVRPEIAAILRGEA